eukprot:TRINITY_DN8765_c0_g1_i1.p1 TRINITY_DN8765_c0_g1~~TRINITY_DN8765_c0_g1_i1.p1  ORF type:complete len:257 (-),score=43.63 TRINITY_DN8765_c0_g1_i1:36-806(-)
MNKIFKFKKISFGLLDKKVKTTLNKHTNKRFLGNLIKTQNNSSTFPIAFVVGASFATWMLYDLDSLFDRSLVLPPQTIIHERVYIQEDPVELMKHKVKFEETPLHTKALAYLIDASLIHLPLQGISALLGLFLPSWKQLLYNCSLIIGVMVFPVRDLIFRDQRSIGKEMQDLTIFDKETGELATKEQILRKTAFYLPFQSLLLLGQLIPSLNYQIFAILSAIFNLSDILYSVISPTHNSFGDDYAGTIVSKASFID